MAKFRSSALKKRFGDDMPKGRAAKKSKEDITSQLRQRGNSEIQTDDLTKVTNDQLISTLRNLSPNSAILTKEPEAVIAEIDRLQVSIHDLIMSPDLTPAYQELNVTAMPGEVLQKIAEYTMSDSTTIVGLGHFNLLKHTGIMPSTAPPLAATCRALRHSATYAFFRPHEFGTQITTHAEVAPFRAALLIIQSQYRPAINRIHVHLVSRIIRVTGAVVHYNIPLARQTTINCERSVDPEEAGRLLNPSCFEVRLPWLCPPRVASYSSDPNHQPNGTHRVG